MYNTLLTVHSVVRWLVLISLLYSIAAALRGYFNQSQFSKLDNSVRHWTATICHVQLLVGILLYTQSPIIQSYFASDVVAGGDVFFFPIIHLVLMLMAIILITIGSAKAKRATESRAKYKTMLYWFTAGLILIFIAIPWPFSPLASRPYIRL